MTSNKQSNDAALQAKDAAKTSDASKRHVIVGSAASLLLLAVILIGINVISGIAYFRYDATEDKVFTLSEGTRAILSKMEDKALFKFYYSKSVGNVPFNYKLYGKKIEEFLDEYKTISRGRINLEVLDPKPDTDEEEWAVKYGLAQAGLPSGEKFYMGLVIMVADKEEVVPFFNLDREEFLEYDITRALVQATEIKRNIIGVMSPLQVLGTPANPYMPQAQSSEDWLFLKELKKSFDVRKVETEATEIPSEISLLLVIHPKDLSDSALYAIDQFVLRGGRLVVMVDPSCSADQSSGGNPYFAKMSRSSDMEKLFKKWGVVYAKDKIAADIHLATRVNAGREGVVDYPIWMSLKEGCYDEKSVITANLSNLMFIESGSLGKAESAADVEMTPLIHTTEAGNVLSNDKLMASPVELQKSLSTTGSQLTLAAMYKGKFKSAFEAPPVIKAGENETDDQKKAREAKQAALGSAHKTEAAEANSILVFADVDFLVDQYCVRAINILGFQTLQPLNDNLAMISNSVDFLGGSEDLISVRSRGKFTRTFTTVEAIEKDAQKKWLEEEQNLTRRLEEIQKRINDLQATKKDGEQRILTSEQREEIRKAREKKTEFMKRRREIRKLLRQDIENLGAYVKFINLVIMPLAVALLGILIYLGQNRKRGLK